MLVHARCAIYFVLLYSIARSAPTWLWEWGVTSISGLGPAVACRHHRYWALVIIIVTVIIIIIIVVIKLLWSLSLWCSGPAVACSHLQYRASIIVFVLMGAVTRMIWLSVSTDHVGGWLDSVKDTRVEGKSASIQKSKKLPQVSKLTLSRQWGS